MESKPQGRGEARPIVWVVDGDAADRATARELLERLSCRVTCFDSAEVMLSSESRPAPACLVVDSHLPGMSGLELVESLARERFEAPIIVIAREGDVRSAVRALKAGAADLIERPFVGQALSRSVRRLTCRPRDAAGTA